jgi:hypothetical protein
VEWFKLSSKLPRDPKWKNLSPRAKVTLIEWACEVAEHETDGVFHLGKARPPSEVKELLAQGLVEKHPNGYLIPAYLKWNRTKAEMDADRNARRNAASKAARTRWGDAGAMPEVEVEEETEKPSSRDMSPDAAKLCDLLADLIEANGSKRPVVGERWLREADRMLRIDARPMDEAESLIRWCQADGFWRANILSMVKFRPQYDQLRLQKQRSNGDGSGHDPGMDIRSAAEVLGEN